MGTNLDELVAEIRAKRNEKLPQAKERLAKLKSALEAVEKTRSRAEAVAMEHPELQDRLRGVCYDKSLQLINSAILVGNRSVSRLSRASVNIGVAGRARQGKSQILQMLTGLGNNQIPTGDGGFCTAARSVVTNGPGQSAAVHFMSEECLMAKKVRPAYAPVGTTEGALGLSPMPSSLVDFLSQPVPQLRENALPSEKIYWKGLNDFHEALCANRSLVEMVGHDPITVSMEDIRRYVAKDTGSKDSEVVDHVEIVTRFAVDLPDAMVVFDVPGLGEMAPSIRETMLQTISDETDIVLLMRKPESSGDDWNEEDFKIMDMIKKVYPDGRIKPSDWVQVVLNHDTRSGHDNTKNVTLMCESATAEIAPVKCDCGSKESVRNMICANMDRLVGMTSRIDDYRIEAAELSYSLAMEEVRTLYRRLREASADIVAQQGDFDFDWHFMEFKSDLRDPLKKDLKFISPDLMSAIEDILQGHFEEVSRKVEKLYEENENCDLFPEEFPIFSKKRLTTRFGASAAPFEQIGLSVRNQREALFKLYRIELEGCCDKLNDAYFENAVAKVFENPAVRKVTHDVIPDALGPRDKICAFERFLSSDGRLPTLVDAVSGLLSFNLTFETTILPAIYGIPAFADFNPEGHSAELEDVVATINALGSKEERAETLYNWQRYISDKIMSCATSGTADSPLTIVSKYVSNIMQASFDSFIFRFIWGENCENEWKRLVRSNQSIFWKEEFDAAERNSSLARDWSSALSELCALVG